MGATLTASTLRLGPDAPYRRLVGVGGVGTGVFFALEGNHDLGRNESRPARLLDVRDYCKLHIIAHYPAVLLGARESGEPFLVVPVAKLGEDEAGRRLRSEMAAAGMDVRFLQTAADAPTLQSVCFQYPDGAGGNITTCDSAAARIAPSDVDRVASLVDARTIVLGAPEVPVAIRQRLLQLGTRRHALRVAAFASAEADECRSRGLFSDVDLLAMNEDEAAALTGVGYDRANPDPLLEACATLLTASIPGIRIVVSAGPDGAFGFERGQWHWTPPLPVTIASTAGAGDSLLGGLLTGLAAGLPFTAPGPRRPESKDRRVESALDLGVLLSAFKLTSLHTIHPEARLETLRAFAGDHSIAFGERLAALF